MTERLRLARAWFDARLRHERIALTAAVAIGLLLAFEALAWSPARGRLASLGTQVAALDEQRAALEGELESLDRQEALDPDAAARRQIDVRVREIADLDEDLRAQALQIIAPDQVRLLLRDLIAEVEGLELVGMQTQTPQELVRTAGDDLPALYRHGLVIELRGDYLALVEYAKALESLPWRFYWLGLEVRADAAQPRDFRLHLYTVSLRKEWIRV